MEDSRPTGITASFWHAGIVVADLDQAMDELGRATGAQWLPPQERPDGQQMIRVCFSQTQPYIELIEGNRGGLWQTAAGPRVDHLAYWTDAFQAECAYLTGMGLSREAGGTSAWGGNWAYFRLPAAGIRIELCDTAGRDAFFQRWNLAGLCTPGTTIVRAQLQRHPAELKRTRHACHGAHRPGGPYAYIRSPPVPETPMAAHHCRSRRALPRADGLRLVRWLVRRRFG